MFELFSKIAANGQADDLSCQQPFNAVDVAVALAGESLTITVQLPAVFNFHAWDPDDTPDLLVACVGADEHTQVLLQNLSRAKSKDQYGRSSVADASF